jgi:hypothetical protein
MGEQKHRSWHSFGIILTYALLMFMGIANLFAYGPTIITRCVVVHSITPVITVTVLDVKYSIALGVFLLSRIQSLYLARSYMSLSSFVRPSHPTYDLFDLVAQRSTARIVFVTAT